MRVTVGKFSVTSFFSYLSFWQWVQRRGWQRERKRGRRGVLALHVRETLWSWLAVERQQWRKRTAGPETRAAMVMHVTSMRPCQEKLDGNGVSSTSYLPVSLLEALTPFFTAIVCLDFLCPCIHLFLFSNLPLPSLGLFFPLVLYSLYNGILFICHPWLSLSLFSVSPNSLQFTTTIWTLNFSL